MKYIVVLGDGMADFAIKELGNKTPLQVANKPYIDKLAKKSTLGIVKTIPDGMKAGSDVANLAVLGYNPKTCYSGRSPLEAVSIGIDLKDTDVTLRANLVTLSDEEKFEDKTMIDYSSGEITTEESTELIKYLQRYINNDMLTLYSGISYRHCLVINNGKTGAILTPPHDFTGKKIEDRMPKGTNCNIYCDLIKKSYELLKNHPINLKRIQQGKSPANALWFWGEGTKPSMQKFYDRYGIKGGMISAVDLLKGIAKLADMHLYEVDGATGNYDTNFKGKADACVNALLNDGLDYVYIHMEAPDECGHHGDIKHKIYSIEQIDSVVVKTVCEELENAKVDYTMLIAPDHPTPIATMTHDPTPVPFMIYRSNEQVIGKDSYDEVSCKETGLFISSGEELTKLLLKKQ